MNTKVLTVVLVVVQLYDAVEGDSPGNEYAAQPYPTIPPSYNYQYGINDPKYGPVFSQQEERKDYNTAGEYKVNLPDGRVQIVTYSAGPEGYLADVKYEGEPVFPADPAPYKPSVAAPAASSLAPHKPAPAPYKPPALNPYKPTKASVPYKPAPAPYKPALSPYKAAPSPYKPAPAPYKPVLAPYKAAPAPYKPAPAPYKPAPAPYKPAPAPYKSDPAPKPVPAAYKPAPAPYKPVKAPAPPPVYKPSPVPPYKPASPYKTAANTVAHVPTPTVVAAGSKPSFEPPPTYIPTGYKPKKYSFNIVPAVATNEKSADAKVKPGAVAETETASNEIAATKTEADTAKPAEN